MSLFRPIETQADTKAALQLTEELYLRAARAMEALAGRVEAGETPDVTETKKTAATLREQESMFLKERDRVLQQCKAGAGIDGDFAIDFDAVRAEIGGKLDRLRRHAGSG